MKNCQAPRAAGCAPGGKAYLCAMPTRLLISAAMFLLALAPHAASADEECPKPWVVVVKHDGSLVEGWLLKDAESGVLVDVNGHTVLVPEGDIKEVVEDCDRRPPSSSVAPPSTGTRGRTQRAAPPPPPPSRGQAAEASFRNSAINFSQYFLRWGGGLFISCGGGLFTTGIIVVIFQLVGRGFGPESLLSAGLILGGITAVAAALAGTGVGMVLGAQLTEFARPGPAAAAPPPADVEEMH